MKNPFSTTDILLSTTRRIIEISAEENFDNALVKLISELIPGSIIAFDEIHEPSQTYHLTHSLPLPEKQSALLLARLREVYTQNPIHQYITQGGKERIIDISDLSSRALLKRTDLYQDIFRPIKIEHQLVLRLDRPGWISTLTINRDKPIDSKTKLLLSLIAPLIISSQAISHQFTLLRSRLNHPNLAQTLLTPREYEIFHWLREGKRNSEIAIIMGRSPRTIEKHVASIMLKTGTETRSAAIHSLDNHPIANG